MFKVRKILQEKNGLHRVERSGFSASFDFALTTINWTEIQRVNFSIKK
jgi:hypothetical protein